MKLELKHIAPYLPYGLKVSSLHTLNAETGIGNINHIVRAVNEGKKQYRPILRPLSDLEKLIDEMELECTYFDWILSEYDINVLKFIKEFGIDKLPFDVINYLIEWHFDIFGLIPQGLAIDINTLNAK